MKVDEAHRDLDKVDRRQHQMCISNRRKSIRSQKQKEIKITTNTIRKRKNNADFNGARIA